MAVLAGVMSQGVVQYVVPHGLLLERYTRIHPNLMVDHHDPNMTIMILICLSIKLISVVFLEHLPILGQSPASNRPFAVFQVYGIRQEYAAVEFEKVMGRWLEVEGRFDKAPWPWGRLIEIQSKTTKSVPKVFHDWHRNQNSRAEMC